MILARSPARRLHTVVPAREVVSKTRLWANKSPHTPRMGGSRVALRCDAARALSALQRVQGATLPAGAERLRDASAASRGGGAPNEPLGALLRLLVALVLALGWGLAACTLTPPPVQQGEAYKRLDPPANDQQSLVFGYLDMSQAPTGLGWMEFRQVAPRTDTPFYQMRVHEGVFYMEKFPPGVFVMGEFGGERRDGKHLAYALPRSSPAVRVVIEQPGLHFVGAYRYRVVKQDGQQVGRFEIDALPTLSAAEVLQRILPYARGTPWEPRIQAEIDARR